LLSNLDSLGRRISLRATNGLNNSNDLIVHVGGELSFIASEQTQAQSQSIFKRLLAGEAITISPYSGLLLNAFAQDSFLLSLTETPLLLAGSNPKKPRFAIKIRVENTDGSFKSEGVLIEEHPMNEFMVVSYNVENLFDQTDEDRNAHYGDFRINPNADGRSSNYGELVNFEGRDVTFTEVKAQGVRKVLLGLDPTGPEVVVLQEIESAQSIVELQRVVADLGYNVAEFSGFLPNEEANPIGNAILSKFPVVSKSLLAVPYPANVEQRTEPIRPVFKVAVQPAPSKKLTLYINHWRSKAGPESLRKASAEVIEADIQAELVKNPAYDYMIVGDLNSSYNENIVIAPEHNDTQGETGINTVLNAQGDEPLLLQSTEPKKYNLHFELERGDRKTHFTSNYGWDCLDHMIVGNGAYDQKGISYIDNSFQAGHARMPRLKFLFDQNQNTIRWMISKDPLDINRTIHRVGGYSDHVPIFARYFVPKVQSEDFVRLVNPGKPD
jgi:endonuclease/exonuclease/phosphatase family metal-dependent hydrolase